MNDEYDEEAAGRSEEQDVPVPEQKEADQVERSSLHTSGSEDESLGWEDNSIYTDAGYIDPTSIPQPNVSKWNTQKEEKPKKEHESGRGAGRIIALCLACAMLGGVAGAGVTAAMITKADGDVAPNEVENAETIDSEDTDLILTPADEDADRMSAGAIYEQGCAQTVGITTSGVTQNMFGMSVAVPVSGSGFIVSEDGYILTCNHVVEDAYKGGYDVSVILYDGTTYPAEIVGCDADTDIAVLKIEATGLNAASLANADALSVGSAVYAIGNPLGELAYTMTGGMVSALDREITTDSTTINAFQIDAAVNNGNSGGPVYNDRGEVVGVVTAKISSTGVEGLGFAIPIGDALHAANEIIENGYVSGRADMGIWTRDLSSSIIQYYNMVSGAYVTGVESGSCAETAGIQAGDIITAIGDLPVTDSASLKSAKKQFGAGNTTDITVYRSGEYVSLTITFDEERPDKLDTGTIEPENPYYYFFDGGYGQYGYSGGHRY